MQLVSIRSCHALIVADSLPDDGIRITMKSGPHGVIHSATIPAHSASPVVFILELLAKYAETDDGREAIAHYLTVCHAFWHD